MDRMHSSHTGSDKSGMALLPCEFPCSSTNSYDDRGASDELCQNTIMSRCDTQLLVRRPILEVSRAAQIADCAKRVEPHLISNKVSHNILRLFVFLISHICFIVTKFFSFVRKVNYKEFCVLSMTYEVHLEKLIKITAKCFIAEEL